MNYEKLADNSAKVVSVGRGIGRPFPPGVSGNPGGRPPKSLLQRKCEGLANDEDFVEICMEAAKRRLQAPGVAGFLQMRELLDRVDGPVKQEIDMQVTLGLAETLSKARARIEE